MEGPLILSTEKNTPVDAFPSGNTNLLEPDSEFFGRFTLTSHLGTGRNSSTWLAEDPRFRRVVALKLFRSANPAAIQQERNNWRELLRRMRIVNHPGIAVGLEFFSGEKWTGISSQYVESETLAAAHLLSTQKLPVEARQDILKALGNTLHAVHSKGLVIHSNINAYNILLGRKKNAVSITDFGFQPPIAPQDATSDASIPWKTACISPELKNGQPTSAQDDIYAYAVVAFQVLTGKNPVLHPSGFVDLASLGSELPADASRWQTVLTKAFQPQIADRYASLADLLTEAGIFEPPAPEIPDFTNHSRSAPQKHRKNSKRKSRSGRGRNARKARLIRFLTILSGIALPLILGWVIYNNIHEKRALKLQRTLDERVEKAARALEKAKLAEIEARFSQPLGAPLRVRPEEKVVRPVVRPESAPAPFVINKGAESFFIEGKTKFDAGNTAEALLSYDMAVVLQSDWPDLLEARGFALLADEQIEEAIAEFTKVLVLNPDQLTSLEGRANAYLANNQNDFARADYLKILDLQPENEIAKNALARIPASSN